MAELLDKNKLINLVQDNVCAHTNCGFCPFMIHSECALGNAISKAEVKERFEQWKDPLGVPNTSGALPEDKIILPNGRVLIGQFRPKLEVRDSWSGTVRRIGANSHDVLRIVKTKTGEMLSYLNLQCMVGTEFSDEGYTFVGEKSDVDPEDPEEYIPYEHIYVLKEDEEDGI